MLNVHPITFSALETDSSLLRGLCQGWRLKGELKRIYTPFNLILSFLREDQAAHTNTKPQARLDVAISWGGIWLRATAINGYFILKLTLAWCTDVFHLKVRSLGRKFDKFHSNSKYIILRWKTSVHQARVSFKIKYPFMAVAHNQISPLLIALSRRAWCFAFVIVAW